MEDAHTTCLDIENAKGNAFFAVYDGHAGANVAKYCGEELYKKVVADPAFAKSDYKAAIKNGFLEMDRAMRHDPEYDHDSSGCTAITVLITDKNILYVGNAGDSRAVLGSDGAAIALSTDHKPVHKGESKRIRAAGGFVESGRVKGNLALSRALGDFEYKAREDLTPEDQMVTADPEIREHQLTDEDEFMVVACDGIWDCMSSQDVISFIRKGIADRIPLYTICEIIMDHCLASDAHSYFIGLDNMTMVIVAFLNGRTVDEWYDYISDRVDIRLGPVETFIPGPNGHEDPADALEKNDQ
ncbi:hypothetical protein BGZ65_009736 [Modicella reniformis]|uniref:protein-serine/threonine phosphatase n=1 Tax=Modicella reniformis TaxID=1440133 RepID=A0A9P6SUS5_9FUNG|nr:hypothetical protein BGZ65_009736 [Modicella reniformis]